MTAAAAAAAPREVIQAVISDFGGVLTTPLAGSFQGIADKSGVTLAALGQALEALHERSGAHPLHELECGRMTESVFVEGLRGALSEQLGREIELDGFADTLWEGLFANEPMIAFMASLRAQGLRMALLTNNVREWELRWRALAPIDEIFELVIDSAFVGVRKPDPEIYELAVTGLGCGRTSACSSTTSRSTARARWRRGCRRSCSAIPSRRSRRCGRRSGRRPPSA